MEILGTRKRDAIKTNGGLEGSSRDKKSRKEVKKVRKGNVKAADTIADDVIAPTNELQELAEDLNLVRIQSMSEDLILSDFE